MEANGAAGSGGSAAAAAATALNAPPNWGQGNNGGGGSTDFNGLQALQHHQMIQQMAASQQQQQQQQPGQTQGLPMGMNPQQAPTLNMMLQSMAAAVQGQGLHHPLQSPPNTSQAAATTAMGPGGQPFFILPQQTTGMQPCTRDMSPNSTPGMQQQQQQPAPSATPPNLMGLDLGEQQRQWALPANPIMLGPRIINAGGAPSINDKLVMEEQLKQAAGSLNDMYHADSIAAAATFQQFPQHRQPQQQQQPQQEQQVFNNPQMQQDQQQQLTLARALNHPHHMYLPAAQSPPAPNLLFQQQQHLPMPPRPRPEGGQDPSPPTTFLDQDNVNGGNNNNRKEDLIIGSWNEEDPDKQQQQPAQRQQQHPPMMPPPPPPHHFGHNNQLYHQQQQQQQRMMHPDPPDGLKDVGGSGWGDPPPQNPAGSWGPVHHQGPPPPMNPPPLKMGGGSWGQPYGAIPPMMHGGYSDGRGRGGAGDHHYGYNESRGRGGGFRGRGGGGGPPSGVVDHSQEKMEGKKSAIADTIALMKQMQMEDKEKRQSAKKHNALAAAAVAEVDDSGHDGLHDEPLHRRNQREREQRHQRGGWNNGMPGMPPLGPMFGGGGGGPIPSFLPPGLAGFPPAAAGGFDFPPGGGAAFGPPGGGVGFPYPPGPNMYALAGQGGSGLNFHHQGLPPGPFRHGFPPRGRGFPIGPLRAGFTNHPNFAGRMPAMVGVGQRGGGRGGYRGVGGRPLHSKPGPECNNNNLDGTSEEIGQQQEEEEPPPVEEEEEDVGAAAVAAENQEPSKNLISEQGNKGQLALFASETLAARGGDPPPSESLRERLTQQLVAGTAECMVCLDKIKPAHATWDCAQCHQVFHIRCIKKWANEGRDDRAGWRCPGCQAVTEKVPSSYRCFCRKLVDPPHDRREVPHSCGETCGGPLSPSCPHACKDLCHPGPCLPCDATVTTSCPCGKAVNRSVRCRDASLRLPCDDVCGKLLNCRVHRCRKRCHADECGDCDASAELVCHCGRRSRKTVPCTTSVPEDFCWSCGERCDEMLSCSNHRCDEVCHLGDCGACPLDPDAVRTCRCGATPIAEPRRSCLDPIPTCGRACGKSLDCGPAGSRHSCQARCHEGSCAPCSLTTDIKCRCGNADRNVSCEELRSEDQVLCDKRCNAKLNCRRHKCRVFCCVDVDHVCALLCGKMLTCGKHRCESVCHRVNCPSCPNVSFDELTCRCGAEVTYPPIPCGTDPPACQRPCSLPRRCGHDVRHPCHADDDDCPPCAELTSKWCHGQHELRKSLPCHLDGISCGKPCDKPLPCSRHRCLRPCHPGPGCSNDDKKCAQPCDVARTDCGHPCGADCHDGDCPADSRCDEKVRLECRCGNLTSIVACCQKQERERRNRTLALHQAQQQQRNGGGSSVDDVDSSPLDCDEECSRLERNRRMATALQIENPDVSANKPATKYCDSLREFAKKDAAFAANVQDRLSELVTRAEQSNQKSVHHYSFDCMNREKRQFVHELAAHFGCMTESHDPEPKRNVVATAVKDKVWLPTLSLVDAVTVQQGQRKVVLPKQP